MRLPVVLCMVALLACAHAYSILGDPGMQSELASVAFEGWNMCNGALVPQQYAGLAYTPTPQMADCVVNAEGSNAVRQWQNDLVWVFI